MSNTESINGMLKDLLVTESDVDATSEGYDSLLSYELMKQVYNSLLVGSDEISFENFLEKSDLFNLDLTGETFESFSLKNIDISTEKSVNGLTIVFHPKGSLSL